MCALAITALGACQRTAPIQPGIAVSAPAPGSAQEIYVDNPGQEYTLRAADIISITVFREENLSMDEVAVSADGQISMPLVGPVLVEGMTAGALAAHLEQVLGSRYLRDPDVSVNVIRYASHIVTVEGAVETPGVYSFAPGTRLSGGLALAEGTTRTADSGQIAVFRQTPEGMMIAKFDYRAVQAGTMLDPVLLPQDRIVVGTDGMSQFWQDFLTAIPVFALFTRI